MSTKPTRREMLNVVAVGAVSLAIPSIGAAQTGQDKGVETAEANLAKPLSPEARKLLTEALKGVEAASEERLKTKLPENSEPCFTYFASTREVRAK